MQYPNFSFYEDVQHQIEAFRDAGIDYLVLNFEPERVRSDESLRRRSDEKTLICWRGMRKSRDQDE
jgi:hypothetical protein